MSKPDEKRQFTRIPFITPCQLIQGGKAVDTQVLDISLHGVLVERPAGWQRVEGEPLTVAVDLAEQKQAIIMSVDLKFCAKDKLGFECLDMDIDSATHLRRLVQLNLGGDEYLSRELKALIGQQ